MPDDTNRRKAEDTMPKRSFKKKLSGYRFHFPSIGQRIIKTTIAVFICLMISCLRGDMGPHIHSEACITAIICMQPYVSDTRDYAISRFAGTMIGTGLGLLMLVLLYSFPVLGDHPLSRYLLISLGVMITLYSTVLFHRPDTSALAAAIYLWIIVTYPDIDGPYIRVLDHTVDVLIGILSALLVNAFRLPRSKNRGYVFFVRAKDLIPDRFSNMDAAVLFRLNYLYHDGARICLVSDHAPAFFTQQMSAAKLKAPMIVMDGAAIFDIDENKFLDVETIDEADSDRIRDYLTSEGISFFVYTIHRNRTCIFHHGKLREEEKCIYDRMRRSPYRDYLEGEIYNTSEIVYIKIIVKDDRIEEMEKHLKDLPADRLRCVVRPQVGTDGISAFYMYSVRAAVEPAKDRLMKILREEDPSLVPMTIIPRNEYRSEHDALHVLRTIEKYYEPVIFMKKKTQQTS